MEMEPPQSVSTSFVSPAGEGTDMELALAVLAQGGSTGSPGTSCAPATSFGAALMEQGCDPFPPAPSWDRM